MTAPFPNKKLGLYAPPWYNFVKFDLKENLEKNGTKKKDIILKVKINNFDLDMQMDTGSEVTLTPRNFWERFGKPTLRKSSLLLRQFDGSVIKTLGYLEGSLELVEKFEVMPIIVKTCKKNRGLLGNDELNINSTKLINEMKMEKSGKLKNYKASLKLKEKVTVHLLPLVVAKLWQLIEQDFLEYVPPWVAIGHHPL